MELECSPCPPPRPKGEWSTWIVFPPAVRRKPQVDVYGGVRCDAPGAPRVRVERACATRLQLV